MAGRDARPHRLKTCATKNRKWRSTEMALDYRSVASWGLLAPRPLVVEEVTVTLESDEIVVASLESDEIVVNLKEE